MTPVQVLEAERLVRQRRSLLSILSKARKQTRGAKPRYYCELGVQANYAVTHSTTGEERSTVENDLFVELMKKLVEDYDARLAEYGVGREGE